MHYIVTPSPALSASVEVPGDKSVSHRALMLGSIASGQTNVTGFLPGEDCLATMAAMRQLGVSIKQHSETEVSIEGAGLHGLQAPGANLDLGNSGTAMRLMAGLLAAQRFDSVLTGDESLSGRPMGRIIKPLTMMGAAIESDCDGTPPLQIAGGVNLHGISYELPVASAQVKSAILLAGLYARGATEVFEPAVARDHTERMLKSMGVYVYINGNRIGVQGVRRLNACDIRVPADLSSAAFVILAALLSEDADILISNVGINPTRIGVIDILQDMGADIRFERPQLFGSEPVTDIRVRASRLRGGTVDPGLASLAIDEFPVLFVAAAAANGETVFSGLEELRVKESDRIAAMAAGLQALGIEVEEKPDGAIVHGGRFHGGTVESFGDHRVAMSLAIAGTAAQGEVRVRNVESVATSFPGFEACMASIGTNIEVVQELPND